MKRFFSFVLKHKKGIGIGLGLLVLGASFRWEVREVDDAQTGKAITRYRGIAFPWESCGMRSGGSRPVNYHVQHWLAYGLIKLETTGRTY